MLSIYTRYLLSVALFCGGLACATPEPDPLVETERPTASPNSVDLIAADMSEPHAGYPSGVPAGTGWATHPRVGYGNTPPAGWTATIPWGQIYADSSGNPATNVRIQIRNMQSWYLSRTTDQWVKWVQTSAIEGANYAEDFVDDVNVPADIRAEPDGGGISATLQPGYNFHFWPAAGRVTMDPADIAGTWTAIESRLIVDDPDRPDDRAAARLLFSAGADYWLNRSAEWDQWKTNGDIGIGRFRYLTADWQVFNMHTLTAEQLRNNPPPY